MRVGVRACCVVFALLFPISISLCLFPRVRASENTRLDLSVAEWPRMFLVIAAALAYACAQAAGASLGVRVLHEGTGAVTLSHNNATLLTVQPHTQALVSIDFNPAQSTAVQVRRGAPVSVSLNFVWVYCSEANWRDFSPRTPSSRGLEGLGS